MRKRTKYSLSYDKLLTMKSGFLAPVGLTEVLPGDTVQHATSAFIRLAPLVSPVMHPVHVKIHHWYVPHRLVWDDFEDFITGGPDGLDTSEFPVVRSGNSGFAVGSLADYLGVPPNIPDLEVSALPFRAYTLIWNEWYRAQLLQDPLSLCTDSGLDTTTSLDMRRATWEKDYFTTAAPSPQLGPGVTVPVEYGSGSGPTMPSITGSVDIVPNGYPTFHGPVGGITNTNLQYTGNYLISDGSALRWTDPALRGNLNLNFNPGTPGDPGIGHVNINALREAFALQRFEEHRALYGSRYVEYLRYLGIKASDARLQRPEYLGGGRQTIQFSEVLQTSEGSNPVGTLRGHGIAAMRSNRYRRFFEEHGYVLTFMTIRPKAIYAQGLPRTFNRRVKEDFYQVELQDIGEQEVLNKELYAAHSSPDDVFGYQARYQEYRSNPSSVAGEFRTILDYWHMARIFASDPALNSDFLQCHPTERIFASTNTDQFYVMAHHSMQARRLVRRK
jgi:hypothetical protein